MNASVVKRTLAFLKAWELTFLTLNLQITLNPEDKELIQSALKEISDKVDYRWKVTQWLMGIAIVLSAGAQVANWVMLDAQVCLQGLWAFNHSEAKEVTIQGNCTLAQTV